MAQRMDRRFGFGVRHLSLMQHIAEFKFIGFGRDDDA